MNPDVLYSPIDSIREAAKLFPTPFFLYEERRIRENCRRIKDAFGKKFPGFTPLFAVKANSNPDVLRIVLDEGFGFDASSESEVWIAKKLSARGMFTGNFNSKEELSAAREAGLILNLDDISMIPWLSEIGVPEIVSFRINPGIGKGSMDSLVLAGPDAKFGVPFEKAADAYAQAKSLGVHRFGIHMMTGSNVLSEDYFSEIVRKLFSIMADVHKKTGIQFECMNIGGGFGVPYRPEEKSLDLDVVAENLRSVFDEELKKYGLTEPRLYVEPGRYITADAGWLVTKVLVVKEGYKKFIGVDAACNDMPRPSIYGAYHHVTILDGPPAQEVVSVVGRICENNDQFAKDRELPVMRVDDVVVIHNCGAHAYVMGHNYNGRLKHAEYLIALDGTIKRIRPAQTVDDLFRGTNIA